MADQVINAPEASTMTLLYMTTLLPCLLLGCGAALLVRKGLIKAT